MKELFENVKNQFRLLSSQRMLKREADKLWRGKALFAVVEDPEEFFERRALRRLKADKLLQAFKVEPIEGVGAILHRKKMLLPPEVVAQKLSDDLGVPVRVIETKKG